MKKGILYFLIFSLIIFSSHLVFAWPIVNGKAICTEANDQSSPKIVSDMSGGAIITWEDNRNETSYNIYAQKVNSSGSTIWTLNGVAICLALNNQSTPNIVSDDSSGAIITWQDSRNGIHIYAQRINSSGNALWTLNGVAICTVSSQSSPMIVSDGFGGAIITWYDARNGNNDIYTQRVNSNGATLWTLDGFAICTAADGQSSPNIVSDGTGGAIITWVDYRNNPYGDIYCQRVNSNGNPLWTSNGVAICTDAYNFQTSPNIVSDGTGGAIITWNDGRLSGSNFDIYSQRVNSNGSTLWTHNGVAICTSAGDQSNSNIVNDGSGGAIITWRDFRSGLNYDIYSQRVNSNGSTLWTLNGVAICTSTGDQSIPNQVNDGSGGAIITWRDIRSGLNYDIYSQRVNSNGSTLWTLNGIAICSISGDQSNQKLISDGLGGAIITWVDQRSGVFNSDIYAQQVNSQGLVPINDWWKY